ncbi:MAG TPA: TadE family protein [Anaerolineales bacterium]
MSTLRRLTSKSSRGQSLVELAISLTVMLLLLSGAVTFGMAYFSYVAMRDAAQEGALFASFNPCADTNTAVPGCDPLDTVNMDSIRERVRASSTSPINFGDTTLIPDGDITADFIGAPCEGLTGGTPNAIWVTVQYNYHVFMPFLGAIVGQEIPLTATVTDTILQPRCPVSP